MVIVADIYLLISISLPIGLIAGFLAGLFGIGGGLIIVPAFFYIFTAMDLYDSYAMQVAVATSLATIIPTGAMSSYTHYKHDAIDFHWFKILLIGVMAGGAIGAFSAVSMPGDWLKMIFAITLLVIAGLMFKHKDTKQHETGSCNKLTTLSFGSVSGAISALMGIGGATLNVPFMVYNGLPINKAIATASLLGLFVAAAGTVVFFTASGGMDSARGSGFNIGHVNYVVVLSIVSMSVITAKYGARLTHKIDTSKLKKVFAVLMIIVALRMVVS